MSGSIDRLYELLPSVYRLRDVDEGWVLQGLLRVITEQADVVNADIAQLRENWFIETCQDWVVPYIGDLVGYSPVHEAGDPGDATTAEGRSRNKILIPRREVANTIRFRRRKGTLAVLDELALAVAGWPGRAVEFFRLLSVAQSINHLRLHRGRTADLHDGDALELLDGPFDRMAHTVDVRRIVSSHDPGRYNIPSVGLFVWRLKTYPVSVEESTAVREMPACCVESVGPQCFTFSVLGNDAPLFNHPQRQTNPTKIAGELNLPTRIRRRAFEKRNQFGDGEGVASPDYYGVDKSVVIWAPNWPVKNAPQPVPITSIIPADLTGWRYRPVPGTVAVDPELGRFVFPARQPPKEGVWVSYNYGFSADIGGGEYARPTAQAPDATVYTVGLHGKYPRILDALKQWKQDQKANAVIEITDSGVYVEQISISLAKGQTLQIRAAHRKRPVIRLLDWQTSQADNLSVQGDNGGWFTLDGLMVTGRGLDLSGKLQGATIRHCTLVPGWGLDCNCHPSRPSDPSIEIDDTVGCLTIEHSIVGAIVVNRDPVATDPLPIRIRDSILDATAPNSDALAAPDEMVAYATLTIKRCTVFGRIIVHAIQLGENTLFNGVVSVARRQIGCLRFCYVDPCSRTPRRYECQPDLVEKTVQDEFAKGHLTPGARDARIASEHLRVAPQFNDTRYGKPAYCQLAQACAAEIATGADDESEMGVFHDLFQPQRAANLRVRLDEYTPAGMEAGIILAT